MSLVCDKSDQHNAVYISYNDELVVKITGKVKVKSISNTYSLSNILEFDLTDKDQKHTICNQFVTFNCNGY